MKHLPIAKNIDNSLIEQNKLLKEQLEESKRIISMLRYTIERHRQEIIYYRKERDMS